MTKLKEFLTACKDIALDWFCITLLLIPGVADWIDSHDKVKP